MLTLALILPLIGVLFLLVYPLEFSVRARMADGAVQGTLYLHLVRRELQLWSFSGSPDAVICEVFDLDAGAGRDAPLARMLRLFELAEGANIHVQIPLNTGDAALTGLATGGAYAFYGAALPWLRSYHPFFRGARVDFIPRFDEAADHLEAHCIGRLSAGKIIINLMMPTGR